MADLPDHAADLAAFRAVTAIKWNILLDAKHSALSRQLNTAIQLDTRYSWIQWDTDTVTVWDYSGSAAKWIDIGI